MTTTYNQEGAANALDWVLPISSWDKDKHAPLFLTLKNKSLIKHLALVKVKEQFYMVVVFPREKKIDSAKEFFKSQLSSVEADFDLTNLQVLDVHHLKLFGWAYAQEHLHALLASNASTTDKVLVAKQTVPILGHMNEDALQDLVERNLLQPLLRMVFEDFQPEKTDEMQRVQCIARQICLLQTNRRLVKDFYDTQCLFHVELALVQGGTPSDVCTKWLDDDTIDIMYYFKKKLDDKRKLQVMVQSGKPMENLDDFCET